MREAIDIKRLQAPKTEKNCIEVPPWLKVMYTTNYFGICMAHAANKKNELDHFCIDCMRSFCCNCLSAHALHKYIKIRRYVYCEVIKRQDISKFFDCSGIQAYHTNKSKVLFLKQRSQQQPLQQTLKDHNCIVCSRSLQDASLYCSISCKVSAIHRGHYDQENTRAYKKASSRKTEDLNHGLDVDNEELPLRSLKRLKLRKGVALRAPFF